MGAVQEVVHLIVDADGALRTTDELGRRLEATGQAADKAANSNQRLSASTDGVSSAQSRLNANMDKLRAAQEKQIAVMVGSPGKVAREWDKLGMSVDKTAALQKRHAREMAQGIRAATEVVALGMASEAEARQRIIALERKQADEMARLVSGANAVAAANDNVVTSLGRRIAAVERLTAAEQRMGAVDRAADIAAYGAALDRMAAGVDKVFAAGQRYRASVEAINEAERVGAVSASRAIELRLQEANAYNALSSAMANAGMAQKAMAQNAVDRVTVSPDRAADIAAYGAELERLREKFNPLYAVSQQYKKAEDEIRRAHAVGAIDAGEMAAALEREKQAMLASVAAIKQRNAALSSAPTNHGSAFNTSNLAAQGFDVMATAAFMPWYTVALQQGPQVSQVFNDIRQSGAKIGPTVAGAFMQILGPVSLVTMAVIGLTAAAVQWLFSAKDDAKTLDDVLQAHGKTIEHLTALYRDAAKAIKEVASSGGEAFSRAVVGLDMSELKKQLDSQMEDVGKSLRGEDGWLDKIRSFFGTDGDGGKDVIDRLSKLKGGLEIYQSAADKLLNSMRAGRADLQGFEKDVKAISLAQMAAGGDVDQLMRSADMMTVLGDAATRVKSEFSDFSGPINKLVVGFSDGQFRMAEFIKEVEKVGQAKGIEEQANKVIGLFEKVVQVTDAINQLKNAALADQRAYEGRGLQGAPDPVDIGKERRRINELRISEKERTDARIKGIRAVTDAEKIAAAAAAAGAGITNSTERKIREENAALEERERLTAEATQSAKDRDVQRQADIARQQLEMDLIGKSVGEVARLQYQYEQLAAVKEEADRAGRAVSDKEIEAIDAAAAAIGRMTEQMALANVQRDLLFERQQAARNPIEQRVASEMRRIYGDDYSSQMNSAVAGQIRLNEQWKIAQDELRAVGEIGKDALGGLLDILYQSGDATEKLIGLFAGIGKQFAQMGLEKLWKAISGEGSPALNFSAPAPSSGTTPEVRSASIETGKQIGAAVAPVIRTSLSVANNDIAGNITLAADKLGISARDLATVISYETGGSFSTSIRGGAGNRHIGLIQFGPAEQKKYGAAIGQTFADQMDAVVAYMKDRGLKPGMGLLDVYSTINAGRPGLYNRSDAANGGAWGTVADKVKYQMGDHQAKVDRMLQKEAVRDGVVAGIDKTTRTASTSAQASSTTAATPGAGDLGGNLQNLLSAGGAAIGAFSGGYQSGSPIMGGISGAFTGAGAAPALSALGLGAAAMPLGIIGGAILGVVGGFLGRAKQRRQERKQAQQQLNQNKSALEELFARGEGRGLGVTTQSYNDFYDKTAQLDEIAQKAGDDDLVKKLRDNVNKFFVILEKDYVGKFKGLADAYASGLGSNSPFVQGAAEMEQLREEVKNFVADARTFGELQLKNKRDLTPEQLEQRVAEAERAAQKMVLSNISGVRELGAVEAGLLRLQGAATAAKTSLEQLNMDAEAAAKAVEGELSVALAKLTDNYLRDTVSSLNELSGVGYLNDLLNVQVTYQQSLDNAARLGLDGSLALRELSLSIKGIVQQAGLGADEIALLSASFPDLQFILNGISDTSLTLSDASSQLREAYDAEAAALDQLIAASKAGIAAIKEFRDAMKINDSSPLSPEQKVAEAAKQFRDLAEKAPGDPDAMSKFIKAGQDYLDVGRSYFASSTGYFDIWTEVDKTMERVQKATEGQLTKAEQQKSALDASVSGILKVNDSVMSVKDALDAYHSSQSQTLDALKTQLGLVSQVGSSSIGAAYQSYLDRDASKSELAAWQSQIKGGKTVDQVVDAIANSREAQIAGLYREIMKRDIDSSSRSYWMQSGKSIDQIRADLTYAKTQGAMRMGGIVGAYATGGMVGNGIYDVDSVRARYAGGGDILLAGGEHVTRAGSVNSRTAPTLDYINRTGAVPGNDNSAVVAALNTIAQELREVKAENRRLAAVVAAASDQQVAAIKHGNAVQEENASTLRKLKQK